MWYMYPPMVALNANGDVLRSGTGAIYDESDTAGASALDTRDVNMLAISEVKINGLGITEAFFVEVPECVWRSGTFAVPLSSPKGMRVAAEEAARTAVAAQEDANRAASRSIQFLKIGGGITNATVRIWEPSVADPAATESVLDGDQWMKLP